MPAETGLLLACDLDGTVLPAPPAVNAAPALAAFARLREEASPPLLVYATGRTLASAVAAVAEAGLPAPDHFVCDVGTSVHDRRDGDWAQDGTFAARLAADWPDGTAARVRATLAPITALVEQPAANQSAWKVSYVAANGFLPVAQREAAAARLADAGIAAKLVFSRGIEERDILDLLPPAGGKLAALRHLLDRCGLPPDALVFAGDSGNDADVLLSGCRAILVGNARSDFRDHLRAEAARGRADHLYCARAPHLAGVLEGYARFGLAADRGEDGD